MNSLYCRHAPRLLNSLFNAPMFNPSIKCKKTNRKHPLIAITFNPDMIYDSDFKNILSEDEMPAVKSIHAQLII